MSSKITEKKQKKKDPVKIPKGAMLAITTAASEAAVKAYENARNESLHRTKDNRLHNTKLLMSKYRSFKEYCGNAIYETAQLCREENEEILELMGVNAGSCVQVGSIRNGVVVTTVIMEHVDTMLDCYKARCLKSKKPESQRRWRVLSKAFLDDKAMTAQEIADEENISKSSVYLDIDIACEELSSLIFGLDLSEFV